MNREPGTDEPGFSPSGERRVDRCATDFEQAWKLALESGQRPRIEDWLPRLPLPDQPRLLYELVLVEVELRRAKSESPRPEEYQQRFPQHVDVVEAAFKLIDERARPDASLAATFIPGSDQDTSGGSSKPAMPRFYQNLLGKRPGLDGPMPKAKALAEAKEWLRELSADEAAKLIAAATNGVSRGDRGKGEHLNLAVPPADPKQPAAKADKPFAHPRFWSAFILIGDPN